MKVRDIVDVMNENPDFSPGWKPVEQTLPDGRKIVTALDNPSFGSHRIVVVCRDDGSPLYDVPQKEEGPLNNETGRRPLSSGAVIVPYFSSSSQLYHVGLIRTIRPLVTDPSTLTQGNYQSLEVPRGFGKLKEDSDATAVRELGEETRRIAKDLHRIGRVNPNTAFDVTPGIPVFAAEVDPTIVDYLRPDSKEPILKCEFYPYSEVRKMVSGGDIYCGLSLAALMLFDTHLQKSQEKS